MTLNEHEIKRLKNMEVPTGTVDCVLDTDTYNEIDDQYALSLMVKSAKLNVKGFCAAPFSSKDFKDPGDGMERSYLEIFHLLDLLGRSDLKSVTFRGSKTYLPDEKTPCDSPAARFLVECSKAYSQDRPLYVVAIGAITNVASAILLDPGIADRIVLVWLGGNHPIWPDTKEYNLYQDVAAARVVFGCGCPLVQLPAMGVVSAFYTTKPELEEWLIGKNPLCDYLATHTIEAAESYAKGRVWSRPIWDVTAIGWLLNDNDRYMISELVPTPMPEYDGSWGYRPLAPLMRRVIFIHRDALMGELFSVLAK